MLTVFIICLPYLATRIFISEPWLISSALFLRVIAFPGMRFERSREEASHSSLLVLTAAEISDAHNSGGTCALQQSFRLVGSAVAVFVRPAGNPWIAFQ